MKRNYIGRCCALAILGAMSSFSVAQSSWKASQGLTPEAVTYAQTAESGIVHFGYTTPNAVIYPYDGLSIDRDAKVGVAILLTRDKFKEYIGGKLSALCLGWDTEEMDGHVETFVRTSFHGKNLASSKATLSFGWNVAELDSAITIPDVDTLVLGYYTKLKKDVITIPKVYPQNQKNSCYLWMEGDMDAQGKELWMDACDLGTMCILGMIDDEKGKFNNMLNVNNISFDYIVKRDSLLSALVDVFNAGSNPINEVEVTSDFNGKKWTKTIPLGSSINPAAYGRIMLPYCALGSGKNQYYVSKVNGTEVEKPKTFDVNLVTIPQDVASRYTLHHLIEFWTSENIYSHVTYFDQYTRPSLDKYSDRMSLICQHVDDQFMTGEQDDACQMMLDFVNQDSLQIFLPSMSLNRNCYVLNRAANESGPIFPVLYPEYGDMLFKDLLNSPTFASIQANAQMDAEGKKAHIEVSGDVAENVLPEGEPLYLTAYLVEYDVESDSQIFWDEQESSKYNGVYKHYNIIRQILTPIYGERLTKTGGDFKQSFDVEIQDHWNDSKLGVIAFLNRGSERDHMERQIINSCETRIGSTTGVENIEMNSANEVPAEIYNMAGAKVNGLQGKGVYIVKSMKNGKPVVRKVLVR